MGMANVNTTRRDRLLRAAALAEIIASTGETLSVALVLIDKAAADRVNKDWRDYRRAASDWRREAHELTASTEG